MGQLDIEPFDQMSLIFTASVFLLSVCPIGCYEVIILQ